MHVQPAVILTANEIDTLAAANTRIDSVFPVHGTYDSYGPAVAATMTTYPADDPNRVALTIAATPGEPLTEERLTAARRTVSALHEHAVTEANPEYWTAQGEPSEYAAMAANLAAKEIDVILAPALRVLDTALTAVDSYQRA